MPVENFSRVHDQINIFFYSAFRKKAVNSITLYMGGMTCYPAQKRLIFCSQLAYRLQHELSMGAGIEDLKHRLDESWESDRRIYS